MPKIAKSASELLDFVNAEMARCDTCASVKATDAFAINDDGAFDVSLRASGVPAEVARPTVLAIVTKLNELYRLDE
jgi:hypothetical protein